jgi:hypothetical protein
LDGTASQLERPVTTSYASLVIIRQAPMAVQNTIQPTITRDATTVDSGISRFLLNPPPPGPPPPPNGVDNPPGSMWTMATPPTVRSRLTRCVITWR